METNELGKYLRDLRKSCGYTQEYVASQLNIIHQTYSHYETGRICPPADALYLLARFYHIPSENLLRLTIPNNTHKDIVPNQFYIETSEELSAFLEHMKEPTQYVKYKHLSPKEKRVLYYYQQLNPRNQDKLLDMIKLELKHQKMVQT